MLQEAQGLCRKHRRAVHVRARLFQRSRCSSLQPTSHTPTRCNCRKTHLAFITKLNVCLALRCDCLRDGDTDGVTVDNMQTLRKPLEKCLLGPCPLFPFDLADQQSAVTASMSMGAAAAAAAASGGAAADAEGGTLVRCHCSSRPARHVIHRRALVACCLSHCDAALASCSCRPCPSLKAPDFWIFE